MSSSNKEKALNPEEVGFDPEARDEQEARVVEAMDPEQRAEWERQSESRRTIRAEREAADQAKLVEAREFVKQNVPELAALLEAKDADTAKPKGWLDRLKGMFE